MSIDSTLPSKAESSTSESLAAGADAAGTTASLNKTASGSTTWHTVRPWTPRFALTVREITSVSTTFVLSAVDDPSSQPSGTSFPSTSIANAHNSIDDDGIDSPQPVARPVRLVADVLARGLSVRVNGAAWKRVLMRMDDSGGETGGGADAAVVVLYGLMPGRQYDVELGILFGSVGGSGGGGSATGEGGKDVFGDMAGAEVLRSRMVTAPLPTTSSAQQQALGFSGNGEMLFKSIGDKQLIANSFY